MADWTFVPQARNGSAYGELTQLEDRVIDLQLNRKCSVTARIPLSHPTAQRAWLTPGVSEMKVYRDGIAIETVFVLETARISPEDPFHLELVWGGIFGLLQDALVLGQTSAYGPSTTLPWTWINTYQLRTGAVTAITQGTTYGTATSQSRTVQQDEGLAESIIALAEYQSGFDFRINPSRELELWYPRRGDDRRTTRPLVLAKGVNVRSFGFEEDAGPGKIANEARVYGGIDNGVATASNTDSRTLYGRREAAVIAAGEIDVSGSYLSTFATNIVDERAKPLIIPEVRVDSTHATTRFEQYGLGDIVPFQAAIASFLEINADYRIVGQRIALDSMNNETTTLALNLWED